MHVREFQSNALVGDVALFPDGALHTPVCSAYSEVIDWDISSSSTTNSTTAAASFFLKKKYKSLFTNPWFYGWSSQKKLNKWYI